MSRAFALIPAAGSSTRMGAPKLLLPIEGRPLVLHTLDAWQRSRVEQIVVVVRPDDTELQQLLQSADVDVVVPPEPPPDMKSSLQYGLAHIAAAWHPENQDCWLVAPADMPGVSPRVIDELLANSRTSQGAARILIPTLAGRRGHPVLLPWTLAAEVERLGEHEGLNTLIASRDPLLIPCDHCESQPAAAFADIDTPQDLQRFSRGN